MGLILVPLVEKFAEHLTAIDEAWDNQVNFALSHVLGATLQTALFNAPLTVIVSRSGSDVGVGVGVGLGVVLGVGAACVGVPDAAGCGRSGVGAGAGCTWAHPATARARAHASGAREREVSIPPIVGRPAWVDPTGPALRTARW